MVADTVANIQIIIINSELRVTIGCGYAELLLSTVSTKTDGALDIMLNFAVAKAPGLVFKLLTRYNAVPTELWVGKKSGKQVKQQKHKGYSTPENKSIHGAYLLGNKADNQKDDKGQQNTDEYAAASFSISVLYLLYDLRVVYTPGKAN